MANTISRSCYTRNGTLIADIAYQPCSSSPSVDSPCCGTNHQGAGHTNVADDTCEANGLCQNFEAFDGTNAGVKNWWRQGCTDPTWRSEKCLGTVCDFAKWEDDNAPVQKCGENRWCCGDKGCCGISSSVFVLAATVGVPVASSVPATLSSSSRSSLSTTSAAHTTPTSSALSTASPSVSLDTGLGVAAKAGIGCGAAVVVILLGVIVWLVLKLRKKRRDGKEGGGGVVGEQEKEQSVVHRYDAPSVEMFVEQRPVELGGNYTTELPGSEGYHVIGLPRRAT